MAVVIRLQRIGKHKQPYYRVVAADSRKAATKKPIEILGSYDPRAGKAKDKITVKQERVEYWLGVGAKPSVTVLNLLKTATTEAGAKEDKGHKKSKKQKARVEAEKKAAAEAKEAAAEKKEEAKAEKKDEAKAEKKDEAKAEKKEEPKAEKKDEAKA
jgi:small subunit ribosomal protein S16